MTDFKGIRGWKVQTLSTDPSASVIDTGTWASSNDMNTARRRVLGSGIQTAAIVAAGYSTAAQALAENYDGSSWTETADLNTGRDSGGMAGIAPYTSTIYFGGGNSPPLTGKTETWNGTSWTEVADMNTARNLAAGFGASQTAAIGTGGETPPVVGSTELWNGSSWTEVNDLNTARAFSAATGPTTAGLNFGGTPDGGPTDVGNTESWDGTNWTEVSDLNTARKGLAGSGLYTDALAFGGGGTAVAVTENYNGSSWTEVSDLNTARGTGPAGVGTSSASLCAGGLTTVNVGTTEEWTTTPAPTFQKINLGQVYFNSTTNAFKVTEQPIPGGSWASNTAAPTASTERWGTGISSSDALIGNPSGVGMEWNGSAWTDGGTTNNTANQGRGGTGGISAALIWGGTSSPAVTEEYNGTAWTEKNDLNTGGNSQPAGPAGTYTDLISAGRGPGWASVSESWNGTSWTETADLNTARRAAGSAGASSTNCAIFGGNVPPNNASALTETWNGTAWTETTDLNTARFSGMGFGSSSQSLAYVAGGSYPALPPYNTKTEAFDGSSWTEVGDLANGRYHNKGGGSGVSALTAGGYLASPAGGQTTENVIWEVDVTNKTITVS